MNADTLIAAVCKDQDLVIAQFAAWLRDGPKPDDWHRFVLDANWDFVPPELFQWVALQDECDRATALLLFWKSQPEFYLEFEGNPDRVPGFAQDSFDLIRLLRARWLEGRYQRSELAFDRETDAWPVDFDKLNRKFGDRVEVELPSSMRVNLHGRKLTTSGCIDGIPAHFWPESQP